jgi:hypothetical protein
MKLRVLFICGMYFTISSCNSSAQKIKDIDTIKLRLNSFNDYLIKEDFNAMIDFIYPEVIAQSSKKAMIADLVDGMHNADYDIIVKQVYIDSISEVISYDLNRYALAKSRTEASFVIKGGVLKDSIKQNNLFNSICYSFKEQYGEKNVDCNVPDKTVSVIMKGEVYPIFSNKHQKWFILADSNPKDMEKFIPEQVRSKLNIRVVHRD